MSDAIEGCKVEKKTGSAGREGQGGHFKIGWSGKVYQQMTSKDLAGKVLGSEAIGVRGGRQYKGPEEGAASSDVSGADGFEAGGTERGDAWEATKRAGCGGFLGHCKDCLLLCVRGQAFGSFLVEVGHNLTQILNNHSFSF